MSGYRGWYFKGQTVTLEIPASKAAGFAFWRINGRKATGVHLSRRIDSPTIIEAVFRDKLLFSLNARPEDAANSKGRPGSVLLNSLSPLPGL